MRRVRRLTITRGVNGRGAKDLGLLPNVGPGYVAVATPGQQRTSDPRRACRRRDARLARARSEPSARGRRPTCSSARCARPRVSSPSTPGRASCLAAATVLIPGHAIFEKAGSVTNVEGRVQRIRAALPPASATPVETRVLTSIAIEMGAVGWGIGRSARGQPPPARGARRRMARRPTVGAPCSPRRPWRDRAAISGGCCSSRRGARRLPPHRIRVSDARRTQGLGAHPAPVRPEPGRSVRPAAARGGRAQALLQGERRTRRRATRSCTSSGPASRVVRRCSPTR